MLASGIGREIRDGAVEVTYLKRILRCDEHSGALYWLPRTTDMFQDSGWGQEMSCRAWNARYAGKEAFTSCNSNGYRHGTINGANYTAHRVIWALLHGEWPPAQIDHINGDRLDNRPVNLRCVTSAENLRNMRLSRRNSSGVVGVGVHKPSGRWHARITHDRRAISLGYFDTFDEAVQARKAGEREYGFHPNHGRAA